MPTLRNRTTKPGNCIRWKPHPKAKRPSTYQITDRAMSFLRSVGCSVPNPGDEEELDDDLCRPLRILGDLHFEEEESPGNVELTEVGEIERKFGTGISPEKRAELKEYIESHPRLTNDKRDELSKELSDLADTAPASDSGGEQQETHGGVEGVDVDLDDLFRDDNGDEMSEALDDVDKALKEWQPRWIGETSDANAIDEVFLEDRPEDWREEIVNIPGFANSIRTMQAVEMESDFEVKHVSVEGGGLEYQMRKFAVGIECTEIVD